MQSRAVILYPPALTQDSLMVGDRIGVRISMVVPSGATVVPPPAENGFGPFVVKEWTVDKTERSSSDSLTYRYVLTLYTTDQCTIPALPFIHVAADSIRDTFMTEPVIMKIVSVLPADTVDIQDLKPQQSAGRPSLVWLWIIFIVLVLIAGIFIGRRFFSKAPTAPPPPPPKPAYEEAIEALAALEAKQYLLKGMVRAYVFELSDILKRFIGRRFDTNAADFTTGEMLDWIVQAPLGQDVRRSMEWFFTETDPVKFAKHIPDRDTVLRFGEVARECIEKTRPLPQAEKPSGGASGGNGAVEGS